MNKLKIGIVVFNAIALFFIGMSIFTDKTLLSGIVILLIGYGSLLIGSILQIVRTKIENK